MKSSRLSLVSLLLLSSLLQASLTPSDNKYIHAYNAEISTLNRNFSSLRTLQDYTDKSKRQRVERSFQNLNSIIAKFSDQKDVQVIRMKKSLTKMQNIYKKNSKSAGISQQKARKKPTKSSSVATLTNLINSFNQNMKSATIDINAMNNSSAYADSTKQKRLKQHQRELLELLSKIKREDMATFKSAHTNYMQWEEYYRDVAQDFSGPDALKNQPAPNPETQNSFTASDKKNLKKFRNEYIANDYMFRSIDSLALQDPKQRAAFEVALKKLQKLLNPMRSKTFNRGIKRADSDLKKLEDIYAKALRKSKRQAEMVTGDLQKELQAIQRVFNKTNFDPRLLIDYQKERFKSPQEVKEWAQTLKTYKTIYPKMLSFLQNVQQNSIKGRTQEFSRYTYWFQNSVMQSIDSAIESQQNRWSHPLIVASKYNALGDDGMKSHLRDQNGVKDTAKMYEDAIKALTNQKAFEKAMYGRYSKKSLKYESELQNIYRYIEVALQERIKEKRLPQALSHDKTILSLAKKHLKGYIDEAGASHISHMRITSEPALFEKVYYEDGAFHLKVSKKFNVTFVREYKGKYYVVLASFLNILKDYHRPIRGFNRWGLNGVNPLEYCDEILKENLDK